MASLADALAAIDQHVPDVILLPTLMATAVEEYVIAYLSALQGTAHVQILGLPRLAGPGDAVPLPARSLFPWRWRRRAPRALIIPGCDPGVFRQDVAAYLASARALKAEIKRSRWGVELSDAPERRRATRFANAEVPWIGIVNFEGGRAALINVSSRGALLQTDSRPGPHLLKRLDPQVRHRSRLTLELEWEQEVHAEGRVIRCVPLDTRAQNRYEIAFAFDRVTGLHLPGGDDLVPALTSGEGDEPAGLPARHLLTAGARR